MKTILIIVAIFGIQFSTLVANNIGDVVTPSELNSLVCPKCPVLIPEIPMEATFGEVVEFESSMNLNPVVPDEASFCDNIETELADNSFAPITPMQADFDDNVALSDNDNNFAPVVPSTADFNDAF